MSSLLDRIRTAVDRLRTRLTPVQQGLLGAVVVVAVLALPLGFAAASSGDDEAATTTTSTTEQEARKGKPVRHDEPRCPKRSDGTDEKPKQQDEKPKKSEKPKPQDEKPKK